MKLIIVGGSQILVIKTIREVFGYGLREAKQVWDNRPTIIELSQTEVSPQEAHEAFSQQKVIHLIGEGRVPDLLRMSCVCCGETPCTWIDEDLFLDPEHIEVFGRQLLCRGCAKMPMGELLPRIEKAVRPTSRWDLLMERHTTCLT